MNSPPPTPELDLLALCSLLNCLNWPEINGPYHLHVDNPRRIRNHDDSLIIGAEGRTCMFMQLGNSHTYATRFLDLPDPAANPDLDLVAWLAVQFIDWVVAPLTPPMEIPNHYGH